jgi:hypothetical protein
MTKVATVEKPETPWIEMPPMQERIAAILKAPDGVTAKTFANLLLWVRAETFLTKQRAQSALKDSLDPKTIDPGALGRAHDAEHALKRLENTEAELASLHQAAIKKEEREKYKAEAAVIERKITDLAKELATTYPETVSRLVNLFQRIAAADREAANFCNLSPPGHFVKGVEASIGGGEKIIENVRLPVLTAKGVQNAWPPQNNWVTDYAETVRAGIVNAGPPPSEADRIAEGRRVIEHAEQMEAGRLRLNNELAARIRANDAEIRRLTSGELPR